MRGRVAGAGASPLLEEEDDELEEDDEDSRGERLVEGIILGRLQQNAQK